jgi:hypothetical protein
MVLEHPVRRWADRVLEALRRRGRHVDWADVVALRWTRLAPIGFSSKPQMIWSRSQYCSRAHNP